MFAADIRRNRVSRMRAYLNCQWHLDEVFVKINGEQHFLWRAVGHEGEVLDFLSRNCIEIRQEINESIRPISYPGNRQTPILRCCDECHWQRRLAGNRSQVEQIRACRSDDESANLRFRSMRCLQKFAAIHASISSTLQPEASPLLQRQFQAEQNRRSRRVASTRRGKRYSLAVLCKDWYWSDSTAP